DFNWFGFNWNRNYNSIRLVGGIQMEAAAPVSASFGEVLNGRVAGLKVKESSDTMNYSVDDIAYGEEPDDSLKQIFEDNKNDLNNVQARKALQETAFFYPNLKTDEKGNIKIQFTTPESLTS